MRLGTYMLVAVVVIALSSVGLGADGFEPLFGSDGISGWKVSDWSDLPMQLHSVPRLRHRNDR